MLRVEGPVEAESAEEAGLKVGEEADEIKQSKPIEIVEVKSRTYRVGGHVVQEVLSEGEEVAWVKCVVCGANMPLPEIAKLKKLPCKPREKAEAAEEEAKGPASCSASLRRG